MMHVRQLFVPSIVTPIVRNASGELHDMGNGIACFSFTRSEMHLMDAAALDALHHSIQKAEEDFRGLVIGQEGRNFSAGLDLRIVRENAEQRRWGRIEALLQQGQECMLRIQQSKIPVVAAICGYTLGGACELALHSSAVQAYKDTRIGLVEARIGLLPAWGGIKAHLERALWWGGDDAEKIADFAAESFHKIAKGSKSKNAEEGFAMRLLRIPSRISVNRERLLSEAKTLCLELAKDHTPAIEQTIEAPIDILYERLTKEAEILRASEERITPHREKLLSALASVLSGHAAREAGRQTLGEEPPRAGWDKLSEHTILQSERAAFLELVRGEEVLTKIKKILR